MRDYAEIGWRVRRGIRQERLAPGRLAQAWALLAHPGTTAILLIAIAALFMLDATSPGSVLPVEDTTRFAPLGLRIVTMILAANLVALFLARALPALMLHDARPDELHLGGAIERRRAVPFVRKDVPFEGLLQGSGLSQVRPMGKRGAFGVRGLPALIGACAAMMGGMLLLFSVVFALDDPAPGTLELAEGEAVEVVNYKGASKRHLDAFVGYRFEVVGTSTLAGKLRSDHPSNATTALIVTNLADSSVQTLPLTPTSAFNMPDGTVLRVSGVREIPMPGSARIRVTDTATGQAAVSDVSFNSRIVLDDNAGLQVGALRFSGAGVWSPAMQLVDDQGASFWVFAEAPDLSHHPATKGKTIELLSLEPGFAVTLTRVTRQEDTLPIAALSLLFVGLAMLFVGGHVSVEVLDEVDRVVVRGTSTNSMGQVGETLDALVGAAEERFARAAGEPDDEVPSDTSDDTSDEAAEADAAETPARDTPASAGDPEQDDDEPRSDAPSVPRAESGRDA